MPNLHIIIGDANTRKSSLLRCLSGVGSGNSSRYVQVAQKSGSVITVFCMLSALQENYKPKLPAEFVEYIKALKPKLTDVAITLRVSATGSCPAFGAYLQAFAQAGWPVTNVALLGASACAQRKGITSGKVSSVLQSTSQPTNLTASQVRKVWLWV